MRIQVSVYADAFLGVATDLLLGASKKVMSSLARVKHPKMILGVVGAAIAVPLLGVTISLVGASANPTPDPSVQETSVQQEAEPAVVGSPVVESLPDPLAPEVTSTADVTVPAPKATAESSPSAVPTSDGPPTQEPTGAPKATKTPEQPVVTEPKIVKKMTDVNGSWTPPVSNPGTVSLRAPQLTSDVKVSVTVACSPSVNCVINGDQLTFSDGTEVTVTYRAKATDTHTAWSKTISN